ncbi:MAG: helix-turn-helix transcriptional regulator [Rhodospirillaceae bacterium]
MTLTPAQCRAARAMAKISRQQLADAVSISLRTLDYFEDDQRAPRLATLIAIQNFLEGHGVVFLETWWGAHGILELKEKSFPKEKIILNSVFPTSGEIFVNGVCAVWDELRTHIRNPRSMPDAYDSRKLMTQLCDDMAINDPFGDGVTFSVDSYSSQIVRSAYTSIERSADNVLSHVAVVARYERANAVTFSFRTYRPITSEVMDESGQAIVDASGRSIRISTASLVFVKEFEHPEYFQKSLEWCEGIVGANVNIE